MTDSSERVSRFTLTASVVEVSLTSGLGNSNSKFVLEREGTGVEAGIWEGVEFWHFPVGMPVWMKKCVWLANYPWDLYQGRSIELLVSPKNPYDREEFDTPRFNVSWGCISSTTPEERDRQLESEEDIGCLGTLNTEVWYEALNCILSKSAN
jgi:hypothetical protein